MSDYCTIFFGIFQYAFVVGSGSKSILKKNGWAAFSGSPAVSVQRRLF